MRQRRHQRGQRMTTDGLVRIYRTMVQARVLDRKISDLHRAGKAAFVVSGQNHEGVQIGAASAIKAGHDYVLPYHRDLAVVLTLGLTPYEILLGVFARPDDPSSGGRQMPGTWSSRRLNVISSSPGATQIPHAAGLALGARMRGEDRVSVVFLGEGATSRGDFHEAMTFVGIHRLPVVLVCESGAARVARMADRARAYAATGASVDGSDPVEVYGVVQAAIGRARRGEGPTLVECTTRVDADPLQRIKQSLIEQRVLSESDEAALRAEVEAEVDEAARRAEAASTAQPADAYTRVFARPVRPIPGVPPGLGDPADARPAPPPGGGAERTIIDALRQAQHDLLASDDRLIVLGEDVGPRGGVFHATDGLHERFGDRVLDTPLAESSIVGIGIGLALGGMRPIAEIQFADFIHSAFDQIVSEAAKLHYRSNGDFNVPIVIRAPWGGSVHGALYHSQSIEAFYAHVAGLKVVAPSTPADVVGLLREAVEDPDPVLFLEHKKTYRLIKGVVPEDPGWRVPIGVAEVAREGSDLTIVTYGLHRHLAVQAADVLAEDGYDVEVVDLRTISPLDRDTILASATKTARVLVVHEDNVSFGVGAEVAALVAEQAFYELDAPVRRLGMADVPAFPFAAPLEEELFVGADDVLAAAKSLMDA